MSVQQLFLPHHRGTRDLLCDVLNVKSNGGKVARWIVIGRDLPAFPGKNHLADAHEFLDWLRDGDRMSLRQIIAAISNYAGGDLLSRLRDLASMPPEPVPVLKDVPLRAKSLEGLGHRKAQFIALLRQCVKVLTDSDVPRFAQMHGLAPGEFDWLHEQLDLPSAMITWLKDNRGLAVDNLSALVLTLQGLNKQPPKELLDYQQMYKEQVVVEKEEDDGKGKCVICLEGESKWTFASCGHQCLCRECAQRILQQQQGMKTCPMCRMGSQHVIEVFRS